MADINQKLTIGLFHERHLTKWKIKWLKPIQLFQGQGAGYAPAGSLSHYHGLLGDLNRKEALLILFLLFISLTITLWGICILCCIILCIKTSENT